MAIIFFFFYNGLYNNLFLNNIAFILLLYIVEYVEHIFITQLHIIILNIVFKVYSNLNFD